MNPRVLKRFIIYMLVLTVVSFIFWDVLKSFVARPPGDYYTEAGGNRLQEGEYKEALEDFDKALAEAPNHRGAVMGRAIAFMLLNRPAEAEAEFTYLIKYLKKNLNPEDSTGRGTLAAAYANRGILYDRTGRYQEALNDYIEALKVDAEVVKGPGIVDRVLYGIPKPSSVRKRALYLKQQLALPESERVLRVPELDKGQRMYKP